MWAYVLRRLLISVPVFLGVLLVLMLALRVHDPAFLHLGKHATQEDVERQRERLGLNDAFAVQYCRFVGQVVRLDFEEESWVERGRSVGELLSASVVPTLAITIPALLLTTLASIGIALIAALYRGRWPDRVLLFGAVLGMSVSSLVYVILGQHFGAARLNAWLSERAGEPVVLFAIEGYESGFAAWFTYCLLPVMIGCVVAIGYDTRYYRAVLAEESRRDHVVAARARGAGPGRILIAHVLRNALIPVVTRVMITLPFLVVGALLVESYFNVPGMGRRLLSAIAERDFPVVQAFTAVFAALFILANLLTDLLYALVDPRVRLR